jgi:nitroreductase
VTSSDTFLETLSTTRAIRRFRPEDIDEEDLTRMFFAATRAPSASNRQNFRFLVLPRDGSARRARELLGAEYRRCWQAKSQRDGYDIAARDRQSRSGRMSSAMDAFVADFENIPLVVLPCLIRYKPASPLEGASVYPACQNLLLAARALGYGGVLTQWQVGVEPELRAELSIPDDIAIAGVIALGRPKGSHGPVRRLPLPQLVFESAWDRPAPWATDPDGARFSGAGPATARG